MPTASRPSRSSFPLLLALALAPAAAQPPPEDILEPPKNLQVLPEDTDPERLRGIMAEVADALGVRCDFCHVGEGRERNFAADDKKEKRVARDMMRMTRTINAILQADSRDDPDARIECVTCHRGLTHPATLRRVLMKVQREGGIDSTLATYRRLRQQYYGRAYDFGEGTLLQLAQDIAGQTQDSSTVVAVLRLNLEQHPESAGTHLALGQALIAAGEPDAGGHHLQEALRLSGDNPRMRRRIEELMK